MYIFALHRASIYNTGTSIRCYYFKIWDNGTLIRDLIPAKRISDGVTGLYDIVNDKFYTNAGSGTFTAGPNMYEVTTTLSPAIGAIIGTGYYAEGSQATLNYNNNNQLYLVKNWKDGSTILSTEVHTYSFTVTSNKNITVALQPCGIGMI